MQLTGLSNKYGPFLIIGGALGAIIGGALGMTMNLWSRFSSQEKKIDKKLNLVKEQPNTEAMESYSLLKRYMVILFDRLDSNTDSKCTSNLKQEAHINEIREYIEENKGYMSVDRRKKL
jgi:hypothetical protein